MNTGEISVFHFLHRQITTRLSRSHPSVLQASHWRIDRNLGVASKQDPEESELIRGAGNNGLSTPLRTLELRTSMKTMTCKELGGACDQKLSAESWEEMVGLMVKHVTDN